MDVDGDEGKQEEEEEEEEEELKLYLPGQPLEEGETLEADQSVYVMLHNLDVRLPFLSFDVLQDGLGEERKNVSRVGCCRLCGAPAKPFFSFLVVPRDGLCRGWYLDAWCS